MNKKMRERVLLFRLETHRDTDAFAELYDTYVGRIYRFVFFKVNSAEDAEDLTADVFLRAWHHITEHRETKNFHALLYRIARNAVIDFYRTRQQNESLEDKIENTSEQLHFVEDHPQASQNPELALHNKEEKEELMEAVAKLKDEYREVLTMRYLDELSIGEISDVLEKSNVSVRVTLHRAIKALQRIMSKQ